MRWLLDGVTTAGMLLAAYGATTTQRWVLAVGVCVAVLALRTLMYFEVFSLEQRVAKMEASVRDAGAAG
jgi:hypothetical protein